MTPIAIALARRGWKPTVIGANQPEYRPLPAHRYANGAVLTVWRLSWRERMRVLLFGRLHLTQLTFHLPLQPQFASTRTDDAIAVAESIGDGR
jgi:hypothetical protein